MSIAPLGSQALIKAAGVVNRTLCAAWRQQPRDAKENPEVVLPA